MHLAVLVKPLWIDALQEGSTIQICSGADIVTIYLDDEGNQMPAPPAVQTHECAMCAAGSLHAMAGGGEFITAIAFLGHNAISHRHNSLFQSTMRSTNQSRAPPVFS